VANNAQKTPIARTLNQFAERKVWAAIDLLGPNLPASVVLVASSGIVKVKFELTNIPFTLPQVTVPFMGSEYVRIPIQTGMLGWVMSADAYLGGVTGLGGGAANLTRRANLSALVFSPLGNKNWSPTDDPNSLVLYGPDGVILRDLNKKTTMTLTVNGVVFDLQADDAVTVNGNLIVNGNIQLQGAIQDKTGGTYGGNIETAGNVLGNVGGVGGSVGLTTHTHAQPNDSHGDTEQPTAAPTGGT
jgi:hypothetical protein